VLGLVSVEVLGSLAVFLALAVAAVVMSPGDPLTEPTLLSDDGTACTINDGELQPADPRALAKGMGMDADGNAYALARVIESEAGTLGRADQIGVAWTVINHARESGHSVVDLVTRAKVKDTDGDRVDGAGAGYFGSQGNPIGGYRYVSTAQDSSDGSRALAQACFSGDIEDNTGGAVNFDAPGAYGAQEGTEAGGADTFAANRQKEGKEQVDVPGSSGRVRFWRYA
jgi:hypothetical protein